MAQKIIVSKRLPTKRIQNHEFKITNSKSFKIMRDACKYYFNQQQIPGSIQGRWFHTKYFLASPCQVVFVCLFVCLFVFLRRRRRKRPLWQLWLLREMFLSVLRQSCWILKSFNPTGPLFGSKTNEYSKRGVHFFLEMRCHNFSSQEIAACPLKSK